ncbi:RNA dependent RNA polymerase-domain-containing protein [Schizophyllum amplum]|uniref:RNA-dependent RNA polymerase n=1 Tax=Schizophyllum amplum TaxID=97359 RepID=A0A550BTN4_9AGAR|nr:RNA dependent RNA polymerase-domain-containing protein [Auriculariopsis ampla]
MTSASSTLKREQRTILRLTVDVQNDRVTQSVVREVRFDCRALRILNDTERLVSVHFTRRVSTKRIEEWINECQCQGKVLDVDGKAMRFSWLGYTESQLKEGSLFLLYEDDSWTVERLFEKLGNVKDIPHEMVASISDKPAEDGTLFTDGCGLIRDSCASEVCSALGVPEDTSVFQIRRGGVKGLLVRYPDEVFDLLCPGPNMKVAIRPSMIKYQGGPTVLEVHNVSRRPRSARLNKHFIILLLTLRVPLKAFEDLLRTNLEFIAGVMTSRQRALDALDASLDSDESGFDQELYELLLAGFQLSEPHVKCLLERLQKRSLDSLRKKLNIRVKNSFYLFGVCDERGVLSEGEVYINISGDVKLGTVLVGRNPAYSTSVLRVLQAVNRPELAHCHNCIVFASQSTRSETTKMQGDVDGDYYWVTTDPTLIPPRTSEPPAAIPPRASRKSDYVNEKADGLKVFMRLRRNFTLSSASKAWMDNVTLTPDLADAPLARSLARIVEQAVDLVKSGGNARMLAAELDTILGTTGQESAKARMTYPQWQDPIAHLIATVPASPQGKQVSFMVDPDVDLSSIVGRDRWEALLKEAEPVMRRFNSALANAIKADEELAEDGDEFDRDVLRQTDLVKDKFLKHHFPPDADILTLLASYAKASAWYVAGYTRGANGRGGEAFSWLPYRYLAHIKARTSMHSC